MKRRTATGLAVLFVSVTFLSVVWHFPASWLVQQGWVAQMLPKSMSVTEVSGRWWLGQGKVSWQGQSLGNVEWQWHPLRLLTGSLAMSMKLNAPQAQLKAKLYADANEIAFENVEGTFNLAYVSTFLKRPSVLQAASGDVVLKKVSFAISPSLLKGAQAWPNQLKGEMVLVDFEMVGVHLPLMKITPTHQTDKIVFDLNGTGKSWNLTGSSTVTKNHRFQNNFILTSKTPQTFPSWGGMVMQKTAPNKAVLKNTGRW